MLSQLGQQHINQNMMVSETFVFSAAGFTDGRLALHWKMPEFPDNTPAKPIYIKGQGQA